MNLHSLDALVFPTVRTIPAVVGDPQRGSSCSLGANTGLPSISVPVGFASDRFPIGMELMGRTLEDARLVALAFAFEQATDHRRAPPTTPPLVDMAAPGTAELHLVSGSPDDALPAAFDGASGVRISGTVRLDPVTSALAFDLEVEGVSPSEVTGVALRYPYEGGGWQVAHLLVRPGSARGDGTIMLTPDQRRALDDGDMHLIALTREAPLGAAVAGLESGPG